jgi:hypothetical protein
MPSTRPSARRDQCSWSSAMYIGRKDWNMKCWTTLPARTQPKVNQRKFGGQGGPLAPAARQSRTALFWSIDIPLTHIIYSACFSTSVPRSLCLRSHAVTPSAFSLALGSFDLSICYFALVSYPTKWTTNETRSPPIKTAMTGNPSMVRMANARG